MSSPQQTYPDMLDHLGDAPEETPKPSLVDWGRLVLAAAARRKLLACAVFLLSLGLLVAFYKHRTPLYRVEASILVQRTQHSAQDDPTRSANVLVHRRDNLINLVKQTEMFVGPRAGARQPSKPAWLPSFLVRAPPADDDPMNDLVADLDSALDVKTALDGTITIRIDWPNPDEAYRLVEAAQQNFLEARHVLEISALDEVISILEGRTAALREELDRTMDEVAERGQREGSSGGLDSPARAAATRVDSAADHTRTQELVSLKSRLEAKERAVADVEEFRRRRLADLQAQLDEKRGVYSDVYPIVVNLRKDIEALSRESPQIAALREDARQLRQEYEARLAEESERRGTSAALPGAPHQDRALDPSAADRSERVRDAHGRYQAMQERLNAAQLELEMARSAFKHRYAITWPAEVPKIPVSPKPEKVFGFGVVAALLLALSCAAAPDLWTGRIVQRWQVERALGLPVLGELKRN